MNQLSIADLENLNRSFITPEIAERAGLARVDDEQGSGIVGRKRRAGTSYAGLVFPYYKPGSDQVRDYRLRRDVPDLERRDGRTRESRKYMAPPGRSNMLYFPPDCSTDQLGHANLPIVITEGEKKALALGRVAWHGLGDTAESPRFLALGLSGVWNFRGVIAKTQDEKGNRRPVRGLISDFEQISWLGRRVTLLFDSNVNENDAVAQARAALARELGILGAEVHLADCPAVPGCNGIDDVLHRWEIDQGEEIAVKHCLALLAAASKTGEPEAKAGLDVRSVLGDFAVYHTPSGDPFVAVTVDGHREHHRLASSLFQRLLRQRLYDSGSKAVSSQAVQNAIEALEGEALFRGPERELHIRIAESDGKIYIDLCNESWEIAEVDTQGFRVIESYAAPIAFRRTATMKALPNPALTGDISRLRHYLNVDDAGFALIAGWLVNCFRPGFAFPLLMISGEQGTAKSTATQMLRELVDPSRPTFRSAPRNEQDLMIAATSSWVLAFDNLSVIQDWFSDALCRLSTGGGFASRKLYTNDEEQFFYAKRPTVINGIGELAGRSDLLDRSLMVKLLPITPAGRMRERDLWEAFSNDCPQIFAALLNAVSVGLRKIDHVIIPEVPRMADFAHWATAAEEGLGLAPGAFMNAYIGNRRETHGLVLEDSDVAEAIRTYCTSRLTHREGRITLLMKEFLRDLRSFNEFQSFDDKRFPKTPKGLRSAIERISPNLREIGIFISFLGRSGPEARLGASLTVEYHQPQTSQASQTSQLKGPQPGAVRVHEPFDADAVYARASV